MEYYKTNAIYEHIIAKKLSQYRFVAGNAWQLVYGDNACNPLLLVFAVGVTGSTLEAPPADSEMEALHLIGHVAERANLPFRYIRFATDVNEIEHVVVSDRDLSYSRLTMPELSKMFGSFNLPVSNTHTAKYLNDQISSAYHKWQRSSLGAALTVSDIDLWRVAENGTPEIVFELKRSYYDLPKWRPFPDDYRNFRLLSNLCQSTGMQLKILYNQRIKQPFKEILDNLKIFSVDFSKTPQISEGEIITLEEFEKL
ncbi:MAG: hypothetical protein EOO46_01885 [Flavobacterium sp.]|nr:MAG: hypothetical protein EOO46_01885 [Flavobacterium sp.]